MNFTLFVVLSVIIIFVVANIFIWREDKKLLIKFSTKECPDCNVPFGMDAINNGLDKSSFEELCLVDDEIVHNYPRCHSVKCPKCNSEWVIRYSKQTEEGGSEITVTSPDEDEQGEYIKISSE